MSEDNKPTLQDWYDLCSKHNCLLVDTFDAIKYDKAFDKEYVMHLLDRFQKINMTFIELYERQNPSDNVDQNDR
jgi:hypothetical protein